MASTSGAVKETQPGQCLVHRRHPTRIASLNVRTAKSIAKLAKVSVMLNERKIDMCALQLRWDWNGIIEMEL